METKFNFDFAEQVAEALDCDKVMNTQCFTVKIVKPIRDPDMTAEQIVEVLEHTCNGVDWGIEVFDRSIKNPCPYKPCTSEEERKKAYLEGCELLRQSINRQLERTFEEINKKYGL